MTVGMTLIYGTLRTLTDAGRDGHDRWLRCLMVFDGLGVGTHPRRSRRPSWGSPRGRVQQAGIRPLIGRGVDFEMTAFISTFAVAIVLSNVAPASTAPAARPPPVIHGRLHLLEGISGSWHSVVVAVIAVGTLLALGAFLSRRVTGDQRGGPAAGRRASGWASRAARLQLDHGSSRRRSRRSRVYCLRRSSSCRRTLAICRY